LLKFFEFRRFYDFTKTTVGDGGFAIFPDIQVSEVDYTMKRQPGGLLLFFYCLIFITYCEKAQENLAMAFA
jgi:hypothetical protein